MTGRAAQMDPLQVGAFCVNRIGMEQKMKELGLEWPTFQENEMVDVITYIRSAVRPPKRQGR